MSIYSGTSTTTPNFTPPTAPLQPVAGTSLLTCKDPNIVDDSPNQLTITRNGDVSVQKFGPFAGTTLTTPYYGAYFDGTGDYLTVPSNAALNITSGSTDSFICEAWVYFSTVGPNMSIIDNGGLNTVSFSNWLIYLNASSQISIGWGNSAAPGSSIGILPSSTVPVVGQWYHLALVKTSSDWSLFINGTRATTFNGLNTASKSNSTALYIGFGINSGAGGTGFAGSISNVRIYNGATASAPYSATSTTITVPTAPLTAISGTSLLTCQSSTFIDNSTNNFALTIAGNTRPTTATPFTVTYSSLQSYTPAVFGGSMYFSGSTSYLTMASSSSAYNFGTGVNFTIEAWVYPTVLAGQAWGVIDARVSGGTSAAWVIQLVPSSGTYRLQFFNSGANTGTAIIPLNTWTHIAVVRNGAALQTYVNGVLDLNSPSYGTGSISPGTTAPRVGTTKDASGTNYATTGYISSLRLVNGTALYTSSFVPQNAPPTPVTNTALLLNGTNAGIYDASTLNDFETVGNAQVSTSVKKYGTSSVAFDGTGDYLITSSAVANPVLAFGTGAFTIEFWFYANSSSGTRQLFDTRPTGTTSTVRYMAITYLSGSLNYYTAGANPAIAGGAVAAGSWNYVTLTRSGTSTRLFINGIQVGSTYTDSQDYLIGINRPIIGADGADPATANFSGNIQDLRLTRGIARYTTNFTPPTAPLPTF